MARRLSIFHRKKNFSGNLKFPLAKSKKMR